MPWFSKIPEVRRWRRLAFLAALLAPAPLWPTNLVAGESSPLLDERESRRGDDPAAWADALRLDQIQVIGTHNSYHIAPHPAVRRLIAALDPRLGMSLEYTHRPLTEQLERLGIRQIELDVFADPDGGRFSHPIARARLAASGDEGGPDPNERGVLDQRGLKVLHVQDIDYRTTVPTLREALEQVRDWSRRRPRHVPILVLVELKDGSYPGLTKPLPIDATVIDELEVTIQSVFRPEAVLRPDDVRGDFDSLSRAIRERGWPRLGEIRGRVLFALDNGGRVRDLYLDGHRDLRGRWMFAEDPDPEGPAAAWFKRNDPIGSFEEIQQLVRDGFLVRTRADADTIEARNGETRRRDAALASGAQFVSTDYPEPDPTLTEYKVRLPDDVVARPNPVSVGNDPAGIDLDD